MTRHLPTTTSQATHDQSSSYQQHQRPIWGRTNPQIYIPKERRCLNLSTKKTDNHETDFRCSSISHQLFYLPRMFVRYTLSTTSFPSQTFDETGCDYSLFHTPGKKDHSTVDIHYSLEHHNRIHTEEIDLLEVKESNNLPSWYPLFQLPYQIDVKVTCTGVHVYIEIIYINSSPDPDIFVPYIYSDPSDETIRRLYGIPSEENYISDH